jgi:hypothetical protein
VVGLAVSILAAHAVLYARIGFGPLRRGVHQPEAQALFEHIREETPRDAVVVFSKARVLSLVTGRRASPAQALATDQELWSYLDRIDATHFIVGQPFPDDELLQAFAERYPDRMQKVFHNRLFRVYQIRTSSQATGASRPGSAS